MHKNTHSLFVFNYSYPSLPDQQQENRLVIGAAIAMFVVKMQFIGVTTITAITKKPTTQCIPLSIKKSLGLKEAHFICVYER